MEDPLAVRLARLGLAERRAKVRWTDAREARDLAMADAEAQGMSVREIARHVGMSPSAVGSVLVAQARERQETMRSVVAPS